MFYMDFTKGIDHFYAEFSLCYYIYDIEILTFLAMFQVAIQLRFPITLLDLYLSIYYR